jgi:hypothetical protein
MIIVNSGTGTVTNINTTAPLSGGPITTSGTITTAMATNKLIGRSTAGSGVMEEITVGTGLSLSGGTLTAAGGGITINTTTISSGTIDRALFQGAGNVVQQDAGFVWNNTDKRLILGADQTSVDTNPRLVVVGKNASGTTTLAAFHNLTGNSNALVIRSDGFMGFGALPYSIFKYRFNLGTNDNIFISNFQGTAIGAGNDTQTANLPLRLISTSLRIVNPAVLGGVTNLTLGNNNSQNGNNAFGINIATTLCTSPGSDNAVITAADRVAGQAGIVIVSENGTRHIFSDIVGINTITPNESAALDITSTSRGFLPPRMTTALRDLIATPATGLTIFNTDNNTINQRTSSAWVDLVSSSNYDGLNIAFGTTNGTKIGTATTQKIGFWNATPIVQPTTAVAAATLSSGGGTNIKEDCTFDGYTIGQVVKALRNSGLLA